MRKYPLSNTVWDRQRWFVKQGEYRHPKAGEFYLSGAIPEVYLATNNISVHYHIMKETTAPPKEIVVDGWIYHFSGSQEK